MDTNPIDISLLLLSNIFFISASLMPSRRRIFILNILGFATQILYFYLIARAVACVNLGLMLSITIISFFLETQEKKPVPLKLQRILKTYIMVIAFPMGLITVLGVRDALDIIPLLIFIPNIAATLSLDIRRIRMYFAVTCFGWFLYIFLLGNPLISLLALAQSAGYLYSYLHTDIMTNVSSKEHNRQEDGQL